jgi:hypothetical protein
MIELRNRLFPSLHAATAREASQDAALTASRAEARECGDPAFFGAAREAKRDPRFRGGDEEKIAREDLTLDVSMP